MCSTTRLNADERPFAVRSTRMELLAIRRNRLSDEELETAGGGDCGGGEGCS